MMNRTILSLLSLLLINTLVFVTSSIALSGPMDQSYKIGEKYKDKTKLATPPAASSKFLAPVGNTSDLQRLDDNGLISSGGSAMGTTKEGKLLQNNNVNKSQAMNKYKIDKNNGMLKKSLEIEKNPNAYTKAVPGSAVETVVNITERKSCLEGVEFNIDLGRELILECEEIELERWLGWQDKRIELGGHDLYHHHQHWGYELAWKRKRNGWHMKSGDVSIMPDIRNKIANTIGKTSDHIHEYVNFEARGHGNITPVYDRWRVVWDRYLFKYKLREKEKYKVFKEKGEYWQINTELEENLATAHECHEVSRSCVKSGIKTFFGKYNVSRPCWEEKISYLCYSQPQDGCDHLERQGCKRLADTSCDHKVGSLCLRWKRNYSCQSTKKSIGYLSASNKIFCLGGDCHQPQMESDKDIANVAYLAALKSAKDDCAKTAGGACLQPVKVFPGNTLGCEKVIASMLDCCSSFKGWGKDFKLCQCSSDEKNLAAVKSKGLCHVVGSYCSSRAPVFRNCLKKKTNYCCFGSKLAKIFQEQGRAQLGIGWGSAEHPDCRPLTIDELARIDFSKFNFEELFESMLDRSKEKGKVIENTKSPKLPSLKENAAPQSQQSMGQGGGL